MDTILPVCICIFLGLNLLLLILFFFRKPADPSAAFKEEFRAVRQEQHTGQVALRREISEQDIREHAVDDAVALEFSGGGRDSSESQKRFKV